MYRKKILGMGNAVLDLISTCEDGDITKAGLTKGQMMIVNEEDSNRTVSNFEIVNKSSGGSVANTIAGIGILGDNPLFCGRVRDDSIGKEFINDISNSGVNFLCKPSYGGSPTAKCLVLVTPDGERTMQTFLGASINLGEEDIKEDFFKDVSFLLIEGYLWSSISARNAIKKAIQFTKQKNIQVVFSLSDPGLVKMFKEDFLDFITKNVDILLGNSEEFLCLLGNNGNTRLCELVNDITKLAIMTDGSKGAVTFSGKRFQQFDSVENKNILDTTGAGDMFAAGLLYKLNNSETLENSISFANKMASSILSQYGARPTKKILEL